MLFAREAGSSTKQVLVHKLHQQVELDIRGFFDEFFGGFFFEGAIAGRKKGTEDGGKGRKTL